LNSSPRKAAARLHAALAFHDSAREGRMAVHIGRRELIVTFGGAVAAWPLAARAQQGDRVRRIGVLMWLNENDPGAKSDLSAFTQALADLGWTEGRNVRMDLRWYGDDTNRIQAKFAEADLAPR